MTRGDNWKGGSIAARPPSFQAGLRRPQWRPWGGCPRPRPQRHVRHDRPENQDSAEDGAAPGVSPKASQTQIGARGPSSAPINAVSTAGIIRAPRVKRIMPKARLIRPNRASQPSCTGVGKPAALSGHAINAEISDETHKACIIGMVRWCRD